MGSPAGQNNFTKVYADEFGRINSTDPDANAKQMVAEIGGRGPIECSICVTKGECTQMNPPKYSRANPLCTRRFAPVELSLSHSPRPRAQLSSNTVAASSKTRPAAPLSTTRSASLATATI